MPDEKTVTVVCANPFHRRAVGVRFEFDAERGGAVADVTLEDAEALLDLDPEGYSCAQLEQAASGEQAASTKRLTPIDGIGPSYARTLVRAGIETPEALRAAVPADIETETGIGAGRIKGWQDAAAHTDPE